MIRTSRTLLLVATVTSLILTTPPATAEESITFCESGRVWGHSQLTVNESRLDRGLDRIGRDADPHGNQSTSRSG